MSTAKPVQSDCVLWYGQYPSDNYQTARELLDLHGELPDDKRVCPGTSITKNYWEYAVGQSHILMILEPKSNLKLPMNKRVAGLKGMAALQLEPADKIVKKKHGHLYLICSKEPGGGSRMMHEISKLLLAHHYPMLRLEATNTAIPFYRKQHFYNSNGCTEDKAVTSAARKADANERPDVNSPLYQKFLAVLVAKNLGALVIKKKKRGFATVEIPEPCKSLDECSIKGFTMTSCLNKPAAKKSVAKKPMTASQKKKKAALAAKKKALAAKKKKAMAAKKKKAAAAKKKKAAMAKKKAMAAKNKKRGKSVRRSGGIGSESALIRRSDQRKSEEFMYNDIANDATMQWFRVFTEQLFVLYPDAKLFGKLSYPFGASPFLRFPEPVRNVNDRIWHSNYRAGVPLSGLTIRHWKLESVDHQRSLVKQFQVFRAAVLKVDLRRSNPVYDMKLQEYIKSAVEKLRPAVDSALAGYSSSIVKLAQRLENNNAFKAVAIALTMKPNESQANVHVSRTYLYLRWLYNWIGGV